MNCHATKQFTAQNSEPEKEWHRNLQIPMGKTSLASLREKKMPF